MIKLYNRKSATRQHRQFGINNKNIPLENTW